MYKIMNKGLYLGKVAHDYQRSKKGVGIGSPILVPSYCIYTAHTYDPSYIPSKPKPTEVHDLTYDFAFDRSQIAIALWAECRFVANAIDIDIKISNWYGISNMLDIQHNKADLTIQNLIEISLIIQTITCIYNTYKKLIDDFLDGRVTDFMIDHDTAITAQTRLTPLNLDVEWHNFLFPPRISFKLPGCVHLLLKLTKTKFEGNLMWGFGYRIVFIHFWTPPEGRKTTPF